MTCCSSRSVKSGIVVRTSVRSPAFLNVAIYFSICPTRTKHMKTMNLMTTTIFAAAMIAASSFGSEDPHAKCCAAAKKANKECAHPCCVQATKDGKVCAKCPPAEGEKKPS